MPMVIMCAGCKKKLRIPDLMRGKVVKCPHCTRKAKIPLEQPAAASASAQKKVGAGAKPALKTSTTLKAPASPPAESASKTTTTLKAAKTQAIKATVEVNGKKKKEPSGPATSETSVKKPGLQSGSKVTPITLTEPEAELESADDFEPDPPPKKPAPSPQAPPHRRTNDDSDEGGNASKLVLFGGAFIVLFLVGLVIWYFATMEAPTGKVSGIVSLDGQPVEGANVTFVGESDPKLGPYLGRTDKTGRYALAASPGARLGKYVVIVEKLVLLNGKPLGQDMTEEEARENGLVKHALPADHAERGTTPLRAEILAGDNKIDLELKSGK